LASSSFGVSNPTLASSSCASAAPAPLSAPGAPAAVDVPGTKRKLWADNARRFYRLVANTVTSHHTPCGKTAFAQMS
jgi:hypothetical protein